MASALEHEGVSVWTSYRRCQISVQQFQPHTDWYIRVTAPNGGYIYDGWWRDSSGKTSYDAIEQAKRGAGLIAHVPGVKTPYGEQR